MHASVTRKKKTVFLTEKLLKHNYMEHEDCIFYGTKLVLRFSEAIRPHTSKKGGQNSNGHCPSSKHSSRALHNRHLADQD